ncbi:MAG: hypothetical protein V3R25_09350 [Nitrosomonadaceae bacterium]
MSLEFMISTLLLEKATEIREIKESRPVGWLLTSMHQTVIMILVWKGMSTTMPGAPTD